MRTKSSGATKSSLNVRWLLLLGFLTFAFCADGQQPIPLGTIIPVRLNGTLSSKNAKPNQAISAHVMQDVPLAGGRKIREGTKVTGRVIDARASSQGSGSLVSFTFDRVFVSKTGVPVTTDARALASALAVEEAYLPEFGMGEGETWSARTTDQVGGDTVYWGGGGVEGPSGLVGKPVEGADSGVLVKVTANPDGQCRGEISGNHEPQALWVFSSDACGVYDIDGLTIAHAGRTEPLGVVELASKAGGIVVRSGSGLLLRVIGPQK
jgi:hypothetical protein